MADSERARCSNNADSQRDRLRGRLASKVSERLQSLMVSALQSACCERNHNSDPAWTALAKRGILLSFIIAHKPLLRAGLIPLFRRCDSERLVFLTGLGYPNVSGKPFAGEERSSYVCE
jgi:hypothetical protein